MFSLALFLLVLTRQTLRLLSTGHMFRHGNVFVIMVEVMAVLVAVVTVSVIMLRPQPLPLRLAVGFFRINVTRFTKQYHFVFVQELGPRNHEWIYRMPVRTAVDGTDRNSRLIEEMTVDRMKSSEIRTRRQINFKHPILIRFRHLTCFIRARFRRLAGENDI